MKHRKFIPFFLFCVFLSLAGCSPKKTDTKTNALTILDWPYQGQRGQGMITVYIYEGSNQTRIPSPSKPLSELSEEEFVNYFVEALSTESQSKRVANYTSASFSSPFKLKSDDGSGDWKGTGNYTVNIYVPDPDGSYSIKSIEKTNVYFLDGAATIDFETMTVK